MVVVELLPVGVYRIGIEVVQRRGHGVPSGSTSDFERNLLIAHRDFGKGPTEIDTGIQVEFSVQIETLRQVEHGGGAQSGLQFHFVASD